MHEIKLPQLGQSVEEASIVQWMKQEGDAVSQGDVLFSVQTDKAEIECESTASGVLRKILVQPDVEVPVLTVVALVGDADEPLPELSQYGGDAAASTSATAQAEPASAPQPAQATAPAAAPAAAGGATAASPRARKKAQELGVDPSAIAGSGPRGRVIEEDVIAQAASAPQAARVTPTAQRVAELEGVDLATVQGTGPGGKIMKADVTRAASTPTPQVAPAAAAGPAPDEGEGRRVPLTPMRRIIAERMAQSKFTAPHYYITLEVDMTAASAARKATQGFKASFNEIILYAVAKALRAHPQVNARWADDAIDELDRIHLGFAVSLPTGLIVPVIRDAQNLSLEGVHNTATALIAKARNGKLVPDDYTGSTFTISNLGAFGVDQFTAIINQPNSAILAIGRIKEKPVVIDGGIHIRPMMNMTLSSDHRVIDGAAAAQFMADLRKIIEKGEF